MHNEERSVRALADSAVQMCISCIGEVMRSVKKIPDSESAEIYAENIYSMQQRLQLFTELKRVCEHLKSWRQSADISERRCKMLCTAIVLVGVLDEQTERCPSILLDLRNMLLRTRLWAAISSKPEIRPVEHQAALLVKMASQHPTPEMLHNAVEMHRRNFAALSQPSRPPVQRPPAQPRLEEMFNDVFGE